MVRFFKNSEAFIHKIIFQFKTNKQRMDREKNTNLSSIAQMTSPCKYICGSNNFLSYLLP